MAAGTKHVYEFGPFRLDATERLLFRDGRAMPLPPKVLDTLLLLVKGNGRVLEKDEMMKQLWPDTFVEEGTLAQYISLLRKALGDAAPWIENHPRRGYRFTAPVREVHDTPGELRIEERTRSRTVIEEEVIADQPRISRVRIIAAAVVLAGVLTAAFLIWTSRTARGSKPVSSVAVLPFRTVSDTGDDYLADGITDALITRLANLEGLRVVSYSRVRRFKGSSLDAAEIGRQLEVEVVIEGTVRSLSGQIRFSVHAVDTKIADTMWADDRFEGTPAGLLRMERQLAEAVSLRLRPRLTANEQSLIRKSVSRNVDAYDLVLRARSLIIRQGTAADLQIASRMLEQAIDLDPEFADAHAWLAFVQNAIYGVRLGGPAILRSAISNANRALSIDPSSLIAIHALVQISHHTGRGVEALHMARRALESNPEDLDATAGAALAYFRVGLIDRAVSLYKKTAAAEPGNLEFRYQLARSYLYLGEYQKGIDMLAPLPLSQKGMFGALLYAKAGQTENAAQAVRANLKSEPNDSPAAYFGGWVLSKSGDERGAAEFWAEAARRTESQLQQQENSHNRLWLALIYAKLGKSERALDQVNRALAPDPRHPWFLYFTARIHGLLGNRRQALDYLRAAIENGFLMLPYLELDLWPMMGFYKLRNDPEFLALRAGLARRVAELRERY